jgi:hypothetical protein
MRILLLSCLAIHLFGCEPSSTTPASATATAIVTAKPSGAAPVLTGAPAPAPITSGAEPTWKAPEKPLGELLGEVKKITLKTGPATGKEELKATISDPEQVKAVLAAVDSAQVLKEGFGAKCLMGSVLTFLGDADKSLGSIGFCGTEPSDTGRFDSTAWSQVAVKVKDPAAIQAAFKAAPKP